MQAPRHSPSRIYRANQQCEERIRERHLHRPVYDFSSPDTTSSYTGTLSKIAYTATLRTQRRESHYEVQVALDVDGDESTVFTTLFFTLPFPSLPTHTALCRYGRIDNHQLIVQVPLSAGQRVPTLFYNFSLPSLSSTYLVEGTVQTLDSTSLVSFFSVPAFPFARLSAVLGSGIFYILTLSIPNKQQPGEVLVDLQINNSPGKEEGELLFSFPLPPFTTLTSSDSRVSVNEQQEVVTIRIPAAPAPSGGYRVSSLLHTVGPPGVEYRIAGTAQTLGVPISEYALSIIPLAREDSVVPGPLVNVQQASGVLGGKVAYTSTISTPYTNRSDILVTLKLDNVSGGVVPEVLFFFSIPSLTTNDIRGSFLSVGNTVNVTIPSIYATRGCYVDFVFTAVGPPGTVYSTSGKGYLNVPNAGYEHFQLAVQPMSRLQLVVRPLPAQGATGTIRSGLTYEAVLLTPSDKDNVATVRMTVTNATTTTGALLFTLAVPPFATDFVFDEHGQLTNNQLTLTIPLTAERQMVDSFLFTARGGAGHAYSFLGTVQEITGSTGVTQDIVVQGVPY